MTYKFHDLLCIMRRRASSCRRAMVQMTNLYAPLCIMRRHASSCLRAPGGRPTSTSWTRRSRA